MAIVGCGCGWTVVSGFSFSKVRVTDVGGLKMMPFMIMPGFAEMGKIMCQFQTTHRSLWSLVFFQEMHAAVCFFQYTTHIYCKDISTFILTCLFLCFQKIWLINQRCLSNTSTICTKQAGVHLVQTTLMLMYTQETVPITMIMRKGALLGHTHCRPMRWPDITRHQSVTWSTEWEQTNCWGWVQDMWCHGRL